MDTEFRVISENLRYLREKRGYTQERLAELTGLSASHISKVESGQRRVGMKTYLNILNVLEVKDDEYIFCAKGSAEDNVRMEFQRIIEDCTEREMLFLLKSLRGIKENMREFHVV